MSDTYTPASVDPKIKKLIDHLEQFQLCEVHRYGGSDHLFFTPQNYPYFKQQFDAKGGMTAAISKQLGWDR